MVFSLTDALFGLLGGVMIGLAAAAMLLGAGRIAGISGILGGVLAPGGATLKGVGAENLVFLLGLIGAPAIYALVMGAPEIGAPSSTLLLVAAGLLVGVGTRMGSGCTSGHGVCGLSRLSPRSLAATAVFMVTAAAATTALRVATGG